MAALLLLLRLFTFSDEKMLPRRGLMRTTRGLYGTRAAFVFSGFPAGPTKHEGKLEHC